LPQGMKEEGIDYDEVFAHVARMEAIRAWYATLSKFLEKHRYKRRKSLKEFAGTGLDFEEVKSAFEEVNTGGVKVSSGIEEINEEFAGTGLDFEEVKSAFEKVNTGGVKVSSGIEEINDGSLDVNTSIDPITTGSIRDSIPSPDRGRREGKAPMIEEEETQASRKTKEEILQE
ncbi:hypothetical protein Tco_0120619, partial [Tanacetum coccineum]